MEANIRLIPRILLGLLLPVSAFAAQESCQKVVVTGEPNWPPYSYEHHGVLQGVGVELAEKLFGELDIPIEVRMPGQVDDVEHSLRRSRIDLIVGTFDVSKYRDFVSLVTPGYYADAVSIVVSDNRYFDFYSWYDLMGRIGLTSRNGQIGFKFSQFADEFLFIKEEDGLRSNFATLDNGAVDFLVGSTQFLTVGMNNFGRNGEFEFLPKLVSSEEVYFGFSSESVCGHYAPFLKARVQELRESGYIDKLIHKHINQLSPAIEPEKNPT